MKVIVHLDSKAAIEMTVDKTDFRDVCIEITAMRRLYDSSGTCCFPIGEGANKILRIEML